MAKHLDRTFAPIVRSTDVLGDLLDADPYAAFRLAPNAKRIVTFLGAGCSGNASIPFERDGVRMLTMMGDHVFAAYVPNPRGPVFMTLIEKMFGTNVTTRTWDTVRRCARA